MPYDDALVGDYPGQFDYLNEQSGKDPDSLAQPSPMQYVPSVTTDSTQPHGTTTNKTHKPIKHPTYTGLGCAICGRVHE